MNMTKAVKTEVKTGTINKTNFNVRFISRIGILSALSFLIMYFEFPVIPPPFDFLKLDFSDAIALFGGVAFGPLASILIELLKNVLNFMFHSTTGGIGEIANFVVGVGFVVPSAIIYRKITNQKGLILGLLLGAATMVVVALISNYLVFLPLWGIADHQAKIEYIKSALLPFNIIKSIAASIVAYILFNAFKGVMKYLKISM